MCNQGYALVVHLCNKGDITWNATYNVRNNIYKKEFYWLLTIKFSKGDVKVTVTGPFQLLVKVTLSKAGKVLLR